MRAAADLTVAYATLSNSRFSEAEPVPAAAGEPQPTVEPRAFPQRPGALNGLLGNANGEVLQSIDAFQLRIQVPENAARLPVIIFIPGGGFTTGTGNARWFHDVPLVHKDHCVLVTVNYRIGILGHLGEEANSASSQRPLWDLVLALRWVKQNIARLGGDPENITLAGDSAGAWYTYALSTMEETRGMFRRAALLSMPFLPPLSAESLDARWNLAHAQLHQHGGFEHAPMTRVLAAQAEIAKAFAGKGMPVMPASGGPLPSSLHDFAVSAPRLHIESLALLGTTEEASAFIGSTQEEAFPCSAVAEFLNSHFQNPEEVETWVTAKRPGASGKQRMVELMTLHQFTLVNLELAEAASEAGIPVYLANFSVQSPMLGLGSPHCMPMPFIFDRADNWADAPMITGLDQQILATTSESLRGWMAGFAQHGVPRVAHGREQAFERSNPRRLEFDGGYPRALPPSEMHLKARR